MNYSSFIQEYFRYAIPANPKLFIAWHEWRTKEQQIMQEQQLFIEPIEATTLLLIKRSENHEGEDNRFI